MKSRASFHFLVFLNSFHTEDNPSGWKMETLMRNIVKRKKRRVNPNVFVPEALVSQWLPHHIESVIYQTLTKKPEHYLQVSLLHLCFTYLFLPMSYTTGDGSPILL